MKQDKAKHIFWGGFFAAVFGLIIYLETNNLFGGLWGCLTGIVAGCIKEWSDYQHIKKWDWRDLLATCVGVAVVSLLVLGLHFGKG